MARREARVHVASGAELTLLRLSGREELSRLYRYDLVLESTDPDLALTDLLGTKLAVELDAFEGGARYFNGLVADAAYLGTELDKARYHLTIVPWFWFLDRNADCRIFQQKDVLEIVETIFGKHSIADYRKRTVSSYEKRDYCVQYRESDFNFVSRLLEDEGIYYFFEHRKDAHTLVLIDDAGSHETVAGYERIRFYPPSHRGHRERDFLDHWQAAARVRPGRTSLRDFDFEKPATDLTTRDEAPKDHALAQEEVYDYPGGYTRIDHGDGRARLRLEEYQTEYARSEGQGNAAGLCCGRSFTLEGVPRRDQNLEYLIVALESELALEGTRSATEGVDDPYRCRIVAQSLATSFRPERRTRVPFVQGPQTAVVTGPAGEEIYTDKYSRVKVMFHWDRHGKRDDTSSCWVRVSQLWAGASWGGIHIPRIGQEVVVDFLEGDPDRPIITGRVYNALAMPPYALPANATQSGVKSNSSKGGGGSNELRFEDKKGAEEVWLHAQKDENIVVENDKTETVHHDETIQIDNNRTEVVGVNETLTVGSNRVRNVGIDETVTIGSNQVVGVGANRIDTVALNEARTVGVAQQMTIGAARNVTVGAMQAHEVGLSDSWSIGKDRSVDIGANDSLSVGKNRTASVGENDTETIGKDQQVKIGEDQMVNVGKTITINAGDQITLKTGDATVIMKKNGDITIKGKNILIDGSGKIDIKAGGNITQKGQKILQN